MKTKQLTVNAMLAALCAVLGFYALDFGNIKITFESVPVLVGALMFGPIDGALIGGIGTFISQLIRYGITATTLLWILPYVVFGAFIGIFARKMDYNMEYKWVLPVVIFGEFLITAINTVSLYIDSHIYGYYTRELIFGVLGLRIIICIVRSLIYGFSVVPLIRNLSKILRVYNRDKS